MANTITFSPYPVKQLRTPAQINALFAAIKAVVDAKLDVRGDTLEGNITGPANSIAIINVSPDSDIDRS